MKELTWIPVSTGHWVSIFDSGDIRLGDTYALHLKLNLASHLKTKYNWPLNNAAIKGTDPLAQLKIHL